jgi:ABC-type glycerol-3-phosphate transport system substrate-binding protein
MRVRRAVTFVAGSSVALAVAGVPASLVLAPSVVGATAPALSGSITVLITSSPSATGLQSVAGSFTEETGVDVEFVEVPYTDVTSTVLLAARTGSSEFDVIQYDSGFQAELVAGEALAPLDDLITSSPEYDIADFPEKVQEYAKYQGVSYGLNLSTEPYVLWYRTDLFEELGLAPPATIEEYIANAQALSEAGYFGADSGYGADIGGYYWLQHILQRGVEFFDEESCSFNVSSDEFVSATEEYLSLIPYVPPSAVNGGGNEMTAVFTQEDVGQMVNATGYYSIMADPEQSNLTDNFAAAVAPGEATSLFGWLIGLSADSENPEAGWAFLMHALGRDGVDDLIAAGAPPPGRISFGEDPVFVAETPYWPVLLEAAAIGQGPPKVPEFPEIQTILAATLSEMAAQDDPDVASTMADMEGQLVDAVSGSVVCE